FRMERLVLLRDVVQRPLRGCPRRAAQQAHEEDRNGGAPPHYLSRSWSGGLHTLILHLLGSPAERGRRAFPASPLSARQLKAALSRGAHSARVAEDSLPGEPRHDPVEARRGAAIVAVGG